MSTASPKSNARKYGKIAALVALMVLAAAFAAGSLIAFGDLVSDNTTVYIEDGETIGTLAERLAAEGYIRHPMRLKVTAAALKATGPLSAGRYDLRPGMNARSVVSLIKSGNQTPLNITFNNIRTLPQFAASLGRQFHCDSAAFASALTSDSIASVYGFRTEEFIGMFIPNTYQFYWTVSPEAFVERMNREYSNFWNDTRKSKLRRTGLTAKEVAALASIIDEETARTDEMAAIAGVYINRLRLGMPLQADPTVKYALGDFSLKRILNRHLKTDSPYNTYIYRGLPHGPIRMPSIAAIDAVLDYKEHDYLYFCARADFSGYHSFARTLAEHSRNARAYTNELNRRGIR